MDNNFNDGQIPQQDQQSSFKLKSDDNQPSGGYQQYTEPDMTGMNQQYTQPDMGGMNQQYTQPDMTGMNQQYTQPDMTGMNQQYTQPNMTGMNQQYTQPNMGGMNQTYAQPVYPTAGGNGSGGGKPPKVKKPKKPLTKGKITGLIVGGVAVVAAIVCGVIFLPGLFKSDKEVVVDAFKNSFNSEESYRSELTGSESIAKAMQEKGGQVSLGMNVNSAAGYAVLEGLNYAMSENYDPVNKKVDYSIEFNSGDTNIVTFKGYGDEANTYFELPGMIDGVFSLPNEDIFTALANSELGQAADLDTSSLPADYDLDYFAASETENTDASSTNVYSGYVDAIENIWDDVTVDKQGREKITINDKSVKAKVYNVSFAEEDLEESLSSAVDGLSEAMMADPALLAQQGLDSSTLDYYISSVKSLIPTLVSGDLVIKVYVADDKVVKVASADEVNIMGVKLSYDLNFEAYDGCINGDFTIGVAGETVNVAFNAVEEDSDASNVVKADFSVKYAGSEVCSATFTDTLTKSDNSFTGNLVINADGSELGNISYSGAYANMNKGVSYGIVVDSISVNVGGSEVVSLGMSYGIDTSAVSVGSYDSSATMYSLLDMTESDFENMIMDNQDNITAWMESISGSALGEFIGDSVSTEPEEPIEEPEDYSIPSADETTLDNNGVKVTILGTLGGFTFSSGSNLSVNYYTEEYSSLDYQLIAAGSAGEILSTYIDMNAAADDLAQAIDQPLTLSDGGEVTYSMRQTNTGFLTSEYYFVRDLGNGTFLVAHAYIYDDDDSFTAEQLAECLNSQYFSVVQ